VRVNFEVVEGPFEHKRYKDAAARITINGQRELWHTRTFGELCSSPEKNGPSTTYRRNAGRWFRVVSGELNEHGQDSDFDLFLDQLYQRLEPMLATILAHAQNEAASLVRNG
jgi:hypothetical protein